MWVAHGNAEGTNFCKWLSDFQRHPKKKTKEI